MNALVWTLKFGVFPLQSLLEPEFQGFENVELLKTHPLIILILSPSFPSLRKWLHA